MFSNKECRHRQYVEVTTRPAPVKARAFFVGNGQRGDRYGCAIRKNLGSKEMALGTIAILSPGSMGSAVGQALRESGYDVVTNLDGRSERTVRWPKRRGSGPCRG